MRRPCASNTIADTLSQIVRRTDRARSQYESYHKPTKVTIARLELSWCWTPIVTNTDHTASVPIPLAIPIKHIVAKSATTERTNGAEQRVQKRPHSTRSVLQLSIRCTQQPTAQGLTNIKWHNLPLFAEHISYHAHDDGASLHCGDL